MTSNFLEQFVAEWYEYRGYFLRRNVYVGKLPKGGYECELDIVAFHPSNNHLVHIEPSGDADSWKNRERRFKKKFDAGIKYIPSLFEGFTLPSEIDQIAVLIFASKKNHLTVGGGKVILVSELLEEIFSELKFTSTYSNVVPEQLPIMRTLQFVAQYRNRISGILFKDK